MSCSAAQKALDAAVKAALDLTGNKCSDDLLKDLSNFEDCPLKLCNVQESNVQESNAQMNNGQESNGQ